MSSVFADYIEAEVLPRLEKKCNVKLTKDPDGRAAMGSSSGGSAALIMAWFRNDLYHRVLTTSGTFVNQAWPFDPKYPDGAWGFHETLIPREPKKAIRIFISVGDKDLLNPNVMRDGMHDWVEANHRMAKVLKEKATSISTSSAAVPATVLATPRRSSSRTLLNGRGMDTLRWKETSFHFFPCRGFCAFCPRRSASMSYTSPPP
jgi:hypothetical protein